MRKLFAFISITILSCLYIANASAQVLIQEEVQELINSFGPEYTKINNFDFAIVLPNSGYKQNESNLLSVFQNDDENASITIKEHSGDYVVFAKDDNEYKINGATAILIKQKENGKLKQTLLFYEEPHGKIKSMDELKERLKNDPKHLDPLETMHTLELNAVCDTNDAHTAAKLERALLSIVYTGPTSYTYNVYETSAFSIGCNDFKVQHNGLLLTIFSNSGNYENELSHGKEVVFQLSHHKKDIAKNKQKKDAMARVKDAYTGNVTISKPKAVDINGMNAFEFDLNFADDNGKTVAKGYTVVYYIGNELQYTFFSKANQNIDKNIENFKKTARTLINK